MADKTHVYYYAGSRGGTSVVRSIEKTNQLVIGYQTPAAAPEYPMFTLAAGQKEIGVTPSGIFTRETQNAVQNALSGGGALKTLWPIMLAGMGYGPNDTELFQKVEDLPQTGIADWATWRRACQYLTAVKGARS